MKLQGTIETDFRFAVVRIHFGQRDGQDFVQVSFPVIGDMHNDATSAAVTESGVDFLFDINGFPCAVHMEKAEGAWRGNMDMDSINLHIPLDIRQISEEPGFGPHAYVIPEGNVQNLRAHSTFENRPCSGVLRYALNDPEVLRFVKEKGIDVENHHDFESICALMQKVCQLIHHDGANYTHDHAHVGTIAQIQFAEKQGNYTNCRGIAIILAGVLRAYGFRANVVECWPEKSENPEIHVVCEVFSQEHGKTVLLDPSNNLIYFQNGVPLSLIELREAVSSGQTETLSISRDASHNGEEISLISMLAYMSKNLMFLRKCIRSDEISEIDKDNSICLTSRDLMQAGYPEATRFTCNIPEFYTPEA